MRGLKSSLTVRPSFDLRCVTISSIEGRERRERRGAKHAPRGLLANSLVPTAVGYWVQEMCNVDDTHNLQHTRHNTQHTAHNTQDKV